MKRTVALLLVAIMAITCTLAALTVSAEEPVYTDKVNLLPASTSEVSQAQDNIDNNGKLDFEVADGKLTLTRATESAQPWPSVTYLVNKEIDLSATPYLHLDFVWVSEVDPANRGVNGHIYYTVDGEEKDAWIVEIAGIDDADIRESSNLYIDFTKVADTTGKITVTSIQLTVYGKVGESATWNHIAFAKEGADEEDNTTSDEGDTTTPAEGETTTPAETTSAPAETTSAPAESDKVPTGDAGILLFAVLGVVALAGVAVAVKVRH